MKMDLDAFSGIIDKVLKESEIRMLITMPENSMEPKIEDNTGMGPTIQYYLLMRAMEKAINDIWELTDKDGDKLFVPEGRNEFVDGVLEMLREALKS